MLQLGEVANATESAKKIMALETTLAAQHMKKEQSRNIIKTVQQICDYRFEPTYV